MSLTNHELLVAALAAYTYPPDYGGDWGYGPLRFSDEYLVSGILEKNKRLAKYG